MSGVAVWTDEEATIALPSVALAYWAEKKSIDPARYSKVDEKHADCFVIETIGQQRIVYLDAQTFRAIGISFLRALNLYWETRA